MAQVTLFKYLIISNNYFTMKGFTEKDGVLVIVFANNLIYKWQKFQPSQTSPSVSPLEIAYLVQKLWNFWYQVKILVFLHHLQKEWVLFYLKWAWNECLHLRTSEMSIDMGRRIVQCHTWYLSFFLHWQNFWRKKFTPKNANFSR